MKKNHFFAMLLFSLATLCVSSHPAKASPPDPVGHCFVTVSHSNAQPFMNVELTAANTLFLEAGGEIYVAGTCAAPETPVTVCISSPLKCSLSKSFETAINNQLLPPLLRLCNARCPFSNKVFVLINKKTLSGYSIGLFQPPLLT